MKNTIIFSLNINGIRASYKKGFLQWFNKEKPDILCLQEIRAKYDKIPKELRKIKDYNLYWSEAEKAGYSGTAIFTKEKPLYISKKTNNSDFDKEGRYIEIGFSDFIIINCYVPNGRADHSRVNFKLDFLNFLLKRLIEISNNNKKVIICGDFNIAHTELDVSNPKSKKRKTGFLKEEREIIDKFIQNSFIDIFRFFNKDKENCYTWWASAKQCKKRNIGWRFDYFFGNESLLNNIYLIQHHTDINISDHCPISINLKES